MRNTKYPNIVELEVTGDYALFSDPVMRVGGPSYEALKGILSSVYWKPTFIWYIDEVRVMNRIRTETKGIRPIKYNKGANDLSYYTYLKDCRYRIKAHFEWNENRPELKADRNENKHHEIARRMIQKGGRRDIFLGTRECQGYVEPCDYAQPSIPYAGIPERSFGVMVHGITYPDEQTDPGYAGKMTVRLWKPVMRNGIIRFERPDSPKIITRVIKEADYKLFTAGTNFSGLSEFEEEEG